MSELILKLDESVFSVDNIILNILPYYSFEHPKVSVIKFKDTDKQRVVYRIDVNNETYCLKKVYYSKEELLYVYSAVEWLHRNGLNVPRFIPTSTGSRFVEYNNMLFILTPWINGIKFDFNQREHVISAALELAKLHASSANFMPIVGSAKKDSLGDFYISTLKHFEQLLQSSAYASLTNDKFSKEFLLYFEKNLRAAELSLKISSQINNSNLSVSLCHGDYVNKNLLFSNDDLYIIDFDKCKRDFCAHDISYFLRRLLKRDSTKWDLDLTISFIKYYNSISKLSCDDLKYITSYLAFPQKFWKLSKDYYKDKNKTDLKIYISLLCKCNKNVEYHYKFVKDLISTFEKIHWNINLL